MKQKDSFPINRIGFMTIVAVALAIFSVAFTQISSSEGTHEVVYSKIALSDEENSSWNVETSDFPFSGDFKFEGRELLSFSAFEFNIPLQSLTSDNKSVEQCIHEFFKQYNCHEISYRQSRVMILPIMKKVHIIGDLKLASTCQVLPIQLDYILNPDQSIQFSGTQEIDLSAFDMIIPEHLSQTIKKKMEMHIHFTLSPKRSFLSSFIQ